MFIYLDTLAILSVLSDKAKQSNDLQGVSSLYEFVQLPWFSISVFPCFKSLLKATRYSNKRRFIPKDFFVLQRRERTQKARRTQNQLTGDNYYH